MSDRKFRRRSVSGLGMAVAIITTIGLTGTDAASEQVRWRTATDVSRQLKRSVGSVGYRWQGVGLRKALRNLSESDGVRVAILLDRRVDPGKKLNLTLAEQPLEEVLMRIASANDIGMCQVGPVIYFGPQWTAHRLRTVVEAQKDKLRKMSIETRRRFAARSAWKWDNLAMPHALFQQLADDGKLEIDGLKEIPHDLWAQADLPSITLVERLSLLAAAYDLTLDISSVTSANSPSVVKLIPIPENVAIVRSYPGGSAPKDLAKKLKKSFPESRFAVKDGSVHVKGRAEDHAMISDLLAGKSASRKQVVGEVRIDKLNAENKQVGLLIETLAKSLKLELTMDKKAIAAAGISLDKLVSINVTKATIAEVFEKITDQAGLSFELDGKKLTIRPKP